MDIITRQEAITAGLTKYYVGKTCKNGHTGEFYISGRCVTCAKNSLSSKAYKGTERYKKSQRTERVKTVNKNSFIKRRYGITLAQYLRMVEEQGNKCAICQEAFQGIGTKSTAPNIDHCHTTGKVRGILCGACNKMIGLAKDSVSVLESAILYCRNK